MNLALDLATAQAALQRGNLPLADMVARALLDKQPDDAQAQGVLQAIAQHMRWPEGLQPVTEGPRYLLIKAWNFGFWSELDHVLGALLIAELTGRIPVVHWGDNSLFRDRDTDNAWTCFFQPLSAVDIRDLQQAHLSYFPDKWQADNLLRNELQKWEGPGSRMCGLHMLSRQESVVVCDFHTKVKDLLPWIPSGHPLHGLPMPEVYRHLMQRHIRLHPALTAQIDHIWQAHMARNNWLAVHVRGTDKVLELGNLHAINQLYHRHIEQFLAVNPSLRIFLMTDTQSVVDEYTQRWGQRIWTLPVTRADGTVGVHTQGLPGVALGAQVIIDSWLASRCDFFLGNGASNVSTGIRHLKDWPQGTYFLLGHDFLARTDLSLHHW